MIKLQEYRKQKGLSQSQLANSANVTIRAIRHYEQQTRDINGASGIVLYKLAKALDCTMEDLLEFDKQTKTNKYYEQLSIMIVALFL